MLKGIKEAILYPVSDASWLKRWTGWWIFCALWFTIPLLVLHFIATVRQAIHNPTEPTLPELEQDWKGWIRGLAASLTLFGPLFVVLLGILSSADAQTLPETVILDITLCTAFAFSLTVPAAAILYALKGELFTMFRPKKLLEIVRLNFQQYALLLGLQSVFFILWCSLTYLVPAFSIWLYPALPFFVFSYARLLGFYYRDNTAV